MGSTDDSVTYCGWNIDDIEIYGIQTGEWEPLPEDTGDPAEDTGDPAEDTDTPDEPDSADPDSAAPDDDDDDDDISITACACSAKGAPSGALMALLLGAVGLLRRRDLRS